LGARLEALLDWRKSRASIAIAAAVLVFLLAWLGYALFHHPAQSGHAGTQRASSNVNATTSKGAITGRVTKAAGGPFAGVQVVATDQSGREQSATSGPDGSFRLDQLTPGTYDVRAQPPAGYAANLDCKVELSGSQEQQVNLYLSPTGASRGGAAKPAGTQADAALPPSGSTPIATVKPGKGELMVTSNIDGAKILIDGQDTGEITPHTFTGLKSGAHGVALMKEGYAEALIRPQVEAGGSVSVNVQLSLPSAMVEFDTTPPGAEVTIDGEDWGESPVSKILTVGKHTYKVTLGDRSTGGSFDITGEGFYTKHVTFPQ
jgi:hypothetical protein